MGSIWISMQEVLFFSLSETYFLLDFLPKSEWRAHSPVGEFECDLVFWSRGSPQNISGQVWQINGQSVIAVDVFTVPEWTVTSLLQ